MKKINEIFEFLDKSIPFSSAMSFDNVGIIVGNKNTYITKVLIALDVTREVITEAVEAKANLIISHHPPIFHPLKTIDTDSVVYMLAKNDIAVIACHTNLDININFGVNRAFAKALKIENLRICEDKPLFIGELSVPLSTKDFAEFIKKQLHTSYIAYTTGEKTINTVAICSGAGGEFIYELENVDAFVTGEARHDEFIHAAHRKLPMFVAGHYETEKIFGEIFLDFLKTEYKDMEIILSKYENNPINFI